MKKKSLLLSFCVLCLVIFVSGCGNGSIKYHEPNKEVGNIKYYVPNDYKYREDLRGLFYSDDNRKVYAKGDTTDYSSFYYIDMIKSKSNNQKLKDYMESINTNNLKENDVKFIKFDNKNMEVYERAGYVTKKGDVEIVNYAYIIQIDDDYFYGLTISGPKSNQKEVEETAKSSAYSLQKVQ